MYSFQNQTILRFTIFLSKNIYEANNFYSQTIFASEREKCTSQISKFKCFQINTCVKFKKIKSKAMIRVKTTVKTTE